MNATDCKRVTRLLLFVAVSFLGLSVMSAGHCELDDTIAGILILLPCAAFAGFGIRETAYLLLGDAVRPWYTQKRAAKIPVPLVLLVGVCSVPVADVVHQAGGPTGTVAEVAWAAMGFTLGLVVLLEHGRDRPRRCRLRSFKDGLSTSRDS